MNVRRELSVCSPMSITFARVDVMSSSAAAWLFVGSRKVCRDDLVILEIQLEQICLAGKLRHSRRRIECLRLS